MITRYCDLCDQKSVDHLKSLPIIYVCEDHKHVEPSVAISAVASRNRRVTDFLGKQWTLDHFPGWWDNWTMPFSDYIRYLQAKSEGISDGDLYDNRQGPEPEAHPYSYSREWVSMYSERFLLDRRCSDVDITIDILSQASLPQEADIITIPL